MEGRNLLVAQVLIGVCHMQTYVNKKACKPMNLRTHSRNEAKLTDKMAFSDSTHDQRDCSFRHAETLSTYVAEEQPISECSAYHSKASSI